MRQTTAFLAAEIASGTPRLSVCWKITRADGVVIRSTEHDRDQIVEAPSPCPAFLELDGVYEASKNITASSIKGASDLSVTNLEVTGGLKKKADSNFHLGDFSSDDMEAGLYDNAAVTIFQTCWAEPTQGVLILIRGTLGNVKHNDDGAFTVEIRDLAQALSQVQGRSYGYLCDADLGDARCGVDMTAFTFTGIVDSVTDKRQFQTILDTGSPALDESYFRFGLLTFTSGPNEGFSREVSSSTSGAIELFEAFPRTPEEGDTFTIKTGCNKELNITIDSSIGTPSVANGLVTGDCAVKYDNGINHRGFVNKPGPDTNIRIRTQTVKSS